MYRIGRALRVSLMNQHGYADLGSGDHVDVDILVVERLEHLGRYAGVGHHAGAYDGHLRHLLIAGNALASYPV